MSQANSQSSLNTNSSLLIDNCSEAEFLYHAWCLVAMVYKKGNEQYELACLRYKWHLAECAVCREGLDAP